MGNKREVKKLEEWKDIKGFEGAYQVSNLGKVRSVQRNSITSDRKKRHYKGKVLKPVPNSSGYLRVQLRANGKKERWLVHRLVAMHFVQNPSPEAYQIVNHLDSDFLNNKADNLEWTTPLGNYQHALKKGKYQRNKRWIDNLRKSFEKYSKSVVGYDKNTGERIVSFKSIQESGRNGFNVSSVCNCCNGKRQTHKGLAWRYE